MHYAWEQADTGFYYEGHGFTLNPWQNGFRDAPIPESLKREYLAMELNKEPVSRPDWAQWLDSMSYSDLLEAKKADPRIKQYLDPIVAAVGLGLGCDAVSAYGAYNFLMPYTVGQFLELGIGDPSDRSHLVKPPRRQRQHPPAFREDTDPRCDRWREDVQGRAVRGGELAGAGWAEPTGKNATELDRDGCAPRRCSGPLRNRYW